MTRMMRTPPEERRTMGERARQHVMDRFSLKAVLDLWESQYGELLKRNPKPIRYGRAE